MLHAARCPSDLLDSAARVNFQLARLAKCRLFISLIKEELVFRLERCCNRLHARRFTALVVLCNGWKLPLQDFTSQSTEAAIHPAVNSGESNVAFQPS